MKTNQEFLRGIYEKAAIAREDDSVKEFRRPYNKYVRYAAMAAALALLIVPASIHGLTKPKPQTAGDPKVEPLTISSQRGINLSTNVFDGTVTSIKEEQGVYTMNISIEEIYAGEYLEKIVIRYKPTKESIIFSLKEGEKALFYTNYSSKGLIINEEENGICRYLDIEDGIKVYETYYGEKVYTDELNTP